MENNKPQSPSGNSIMDELRSSLSPLTILQFVSATSLDERVSIVYNALSHLQLFDQDLASSDSKSALEATAYGGKGTAECMRQKPNLAEALACYTRSIAALPWPTVDQDDGSCLALAFADRSAVLFTMGNYEECLCDVEQALKLKCPDRLKYELHARRGDCLHIMARTEDAKKSFEDAVKVLPLAVDLSDVDRKKKLCYVRVQLARIEKGYSRDEVYRIKRLRPPPLLADGANASAPAMSSCVQISQSPEWGRHVRTTRDVQPGEVLIVEDPYVSILWSSNYKSHCYNCLRRFDALIPCKTCQLVMYCSESCRETSFAKYHAAECTPLTLLDRVPKYQFLLTPLRILLVAIKNHGSLQALHDHVVHMETTSDVTCAGFNENQQYLSSDYTSVHHMMTNADKLTVHKLWPYALNAALIVKCLESCAAGELRGEMREGAMRRFVGGRLLRYEMQVASNGYPIDEYSTSVEQAQAAKTKGIGGAVYPTSGLINHSCDANTCGYQRGDRIVVIATAPIAKGEQVFIDYVGQRLSIHTPSSTRRSFLRDQFHFTCSCALCQHGMPDVDLKELLVRWECHKCHTALHGAAATAKASSSRGPHAVTCPRCKEKNPPERLRREAEQRMARFKDLAHKVRSSRDVTSELGKVLTTLTAAASTSGTSKERDGPPQQMVYIFKNMLRMNCTQAGNYFLDD